MLGIIFTTCLGYIVAVYFMYFKFVLAFVLKMVQLHRIESSTHNIINLEESVLDPNIMIPRRPLFSTICRSIHATYLNLNIHTI